MTDEEVEVVARALCKGQGSDPDTPSYWGVPFMIGNRGHGAMGHPVPAWHLFALDARAAQAMRKLETRTKVSNRRAGSPRPVGKA